MALKLGSLYVSLSAQTSAFAKGMASAMKDLEKFSKEAKRVSGEVAQMSAVFAGLGAVAVRMASSVDGPTKAAMTGLENSTKMLAVQVADMLLPALRELASIAKRAAGVVAGLDPGVKAQISNFAVLAVQLAVAAKAFSLFSGLAANVFGVLRSGFAMVASIGAGPLLSIVATIGLVVAAALLLHRAWRKNWGGIQEVTRDVVEGLRTGFLAFVKFMGGVWDFLVDGAKHFVDGLLAVGSTVEKITGKSLGVGGLREGFEGLWKDLKSGSFFSEAFTFGKTVGEQLVDGIVEEWHSLKSELGLDKLGLKSGATIGLGRGAAGGGGAPGRLTSGAIRPETVDTSAFVKAARDAARAEAAQQVSLELDRRKMSTAGGGVGTAKATARDTSMRREAATASAIGAGSWGDAQRALDEGMKGASTIGDQLKVWGARMGPMLAQSGQQLLGAVGDLVSSVVQGAQQGGVWGAVLAAFMEIAKKTASAMAFLGVAMEFIEQLAAMVEPLVAPIFDALTNVLGIVIDVIEPVFKALEPLFGSIGQLVKNLAPILYAIGDVFQAISPILEFLGRVIGAILDAFKPIFELIAGVIKAVATVVLGIVIGLNELAAAFGDQKAKAESQRLQGIVKAMWERTTAMEMAAGDAAAADLRKAAAAEEATAAVRSFADSMTNLPSGYRIQMARYDADLGLGVAGGGGGSTTVISGNITINTGGTPEDADALADELEEAARRDRGQTTGNPTFNNKTGRDPYR